VLARDLNADGDFDDSGELTPLGAAGTQVCDVAFRAGQPLAVMHSIGQALTLLLDKTGDGDFADAGETTAVPGVLVTSPNGQLALNGTNRAAIAVLDLIRILPTD
jgi:hypothetical protein